MEPYLQGAAEAVNDGTWDATKKSRLKAGVVRKAEKCKFCCEMRKPESESMLPY